MIAMEKNHLKREKLIRKRQVRYKVGILYSHVSAGTAGVMVSCKIPILTTRVRFPGGALHFFSLIFFLHILEPTLEEVLGSDSSDKKFSSLSGSVSDKTLKAVNEMGFTEMMEIQSKSIRPLLQGR